MLAISYMSENLFVAFGLWTTCFLPTYAQSVTEGSRVIKAHATTRLECMPHSAAAASSRAREHTSTPCQLSTVACLAHCPRHAWLFRWTRKTG